MPIDPRQGSTTLATLVLGGPSELRGCVMLAERVQVEDSEWCERHPNIKMIVQCARHPRGAQHFKYGVRQKVLHAVVDPRNARDRQSQLNHAMPDIYKFLKEGETVLFHCEQSFHRAPVVLAAVMKKLTGTKAQAFHIAPSLTLSCSVSYLLARKIRSFLNSRPMCVQASLCFSLAN